MTSEKLLRHLGPPEELSSTADIFKTYCGPFSFGKGFLRSLRIPGLGMEKVKLMIKERRRSYWSVTMYGDERRMLAGLNRADHLH